MIKNLRKSFSGCSCDNNGRFLSTECYVVKEIRLWNAIQKDDLVLV